MPTTPGASKERGKFGLRLQVTLSQRYLSYLSSELSLYSMGLFLLASVASFRLSESKFGF